MAAKGYWIGNNVICDMDGPYLYREANRETIVEGYDGSQDF